jgi:hypothetical protein
MVRSVSFYKFIALVYKITGFPVNKPPQCVVTASKFFAAQQVKFVAICE